MKKLFCVILTLVIVVSVFTACESGSQKTKKKDSSIGTVEKTGHKIFVRDDFKSEKISAKLINTETRKTKKAALEKVSENSDCVTYACWGDADKFNRVIFSYDDNDTLELAFNKFINGWNISSHGVLPYTEGTKQKDVIDYDVETFDYQGNEKEVFIWTPEDYDKSSKEKYSTIYLLDGQWVLDRTTAESGCWNVSESVEAMMSRSDNKAIIVAIKTPETTRGRELVPDLGNVAYDKETYTHKEGKAFSDFVADTLVPFVEKNYNVYTDAKHNSICGSSLGGMESFYIGTEHPEKFGTIGALSPAFWMYDEATWQKYMCKKKFGKNSPFVYLYAGDLTEDNGICAKKMNKLLSRLKYPSDKHVLFLYEKGSHIIECWRAIFPEFLKYMFK